MPSTNDSFDREANDERKKLTRDLGATVGEVVAIAARKLQQQRIGQELMTPLREAELSWLDADLGSSLS